MTLGALIDAYLREKNASVKPRTAQGARYQLSRLADAVGAQLPVGQLGSSALGPHLRELRSRFAATTFYGYVREITAMLNWAVNEGHLIRLPALPEPRSPKALGWTPTPDEVLSLLEAPNRRTKLGLRDAIVLDLMYGTGLRRSEVASLTVTDYVREAHELTIRNGKGGKDRRLPIGDHLAGCLDRYLRDVRPKLQLQAGVEALLLTRSGWPFDAFGIAQLVRRHGWPLDHRWNCHALRRAYATHLLEGGATLHELQLLLGHEQPQTTERYTRLDLQELVREYRRTHPRAVRPRRRG